jgi:hypothetical protein
VVAATSGVDVAGTAVVATGAEVATGARVGTAVGAAVVAAPPHAASSMLSTKTPTISMFLLRIINSS